VQAINQGNNQWAKNAGKPGVPTESDFKAQMSYTRNQVTSKGLDEEVQWSEAIAPIMYGACKPDGAQNATALPLVFDSKVAPLLAADVRAQGTTDAAGKVTLSDVAPGRYQLIASGGTVDVYATWSEGVELKAREEANIKLSANRAVISIVVKP
jgi:hypothetical protein